MKWSLVLLAGLLALPVAAQAGSKTYAVQPFERVHVAAGIELDAKIGQPQSVVTETEDGNFDDLKIAVENGALLIGRPPRWFWFGWPKGRQYRVSVGVPALSGLHASSGAKAEVEGSVSGAAAQVSASSSGRVHLTELRGGTAGVRASSSGSVEIARLQSDSASLHASSSGRVQITELQSGMVDIHASSSGSVGAKGRCETLDVSASSGGFVRASDLQCAALSARASSGGFIEAFASKSVLGRASSGGSISVLGKPPVVNVDQSSGGSVNVAR